MSETVECPECGDTIEITPSEFQYGKVSHKRSCPVWVKIDRWNAEVIGTETKRGKST